ncbi:MAG TPA: hypothetical protein VFD92_11745 [Candidatus Binatia bacterium]|nr:hypothetical protein [Candidatus Binatia bacterium]
MSVRAHLRRIPQVMSAMRRARADAPHERLAPAALRALQGERLGEVVRFAAERSPLYRELYRGVDLRGPIALASLPTTGKPLLMDAFDDWATDRRIRRAEVESALPAIERGALHLGEYQVCSTGGTSGRRGLFLCSRADWTAALGAFFRYTALVGTSPRVPRRRIALVTTVSPLHMSARFGASTDVGLHRVARFDARRPLSDVVAGVQAFQPTSLNGYPSMLALLAGEQLAGRLSIAPETISTTSEVRTPEMEERIVAAWGVRPFDVYATTETGITAVDCEHHAGRHVFEDYVAIENVDADGRPVPDGSPGAKLLVTNLWNRTQPVIRYELSDMVVVESGTCACGRTLRRLVALDGRADDVLLLPARSGGTIAVHPLAVRSPFAANEAVRQYQVVYDGRELTVRVVPQPGADPEQLVQRVRHDVAAKLANAGAVAPPIAVELVADLARDGGTSGKLKLIEVRAAGAPASGEATVAPLPGQRAAAAV